MKRQIVILLAVCFIATSFLQNVQASILSNVVTPGVNTYNDVNRERLIKGAGNVSADLEVGDQLESVLFFDNFQNGFGQLFNVDDIPGLAGLSAYSLIEVVSIAAVGPLTIINFTGALAGGVAVEIYEGSSLNDVSVFDEDTATEHIAAATDGDLVLTLGLDGIDDYWFAIASGTFPQVTDPGNAASASFEFGLSVFSNPGNVPIVTDGMTSSFGDHDVTGLGSVFALTTGPAQGWDAASDTTVSFRGEGVIPEPASFVVWGLIAGLGVLVCQRRRLRSAL